jgi:hypothetical protein
VPHSRMVASSAARSTLVPTSGRAAPNEGPCGGLRSRTSKCRPSVVAVRCSEVPIYPVVTARAAGS